MALMVSVAATPAFADDHHGGDHHDHDEGGHWHDGDIHHFHEHDYDHWRGGNWHHGFHEGRGGWWWIVDGSWYFYPAPVYPYPDPYTPPVVVTEPVPVSPAGVPPSYVYYCRNPIGYYPYVPRCYAVWERVASGVAVAPPVVAEPQIAVPPPAAPAGGQREVDDRQLNAYAVEFQKVNLAGPHARTELRRLEKKVEAFRQALYTRSYNAMDILRDADGLEHRIAAQREKLPAPVLAPAPQPMEPPPIISTPPQ